LGKNFHSLALGLVLIISRVLVAIVTQKTRVAMLAIPVYYRKKIMAMCWEHPALTGDGGPTSVEDSKHLFLFSSQSLAEWLTSVSHGMHL